MPESAATLIRDFQIASESLANQTVGSGADKGDRPDANQAVEDFTMECVSTHLTINPGLDLQAVQHRELASAEAVQRYLSQEEVSQAQLP